MLVNNFVERQKQQQQQGKKCHDPRPPVKNPEVKRLY